MSDAIDGKKKVDLSAISVKSLNNVIDSVINDSAENLNASAGVNNLDSPTVPTGKMWLILNAGAENRNTITTRTNIAIITPTIDLSVMEKLNPPADETIFINTPCILDEGHYLRGVFVGCSAGDDLYLYWSGYQIAKT